MLIAKWPNGSYTLLPHVGIWSLCDWVDADEEERKDIRRYAAEHLDAHGDPAAAELRWCEDAADGGIDSETWGDLKFSDLLAGLYNDAGPGNSIILYHKLEYN